MSDQLARPLTPRRPVPVPGSEAALTALRADIARLEAELYELERRTAELERDDAPQPAEAYGPPSARMADDLGTASVEQERADMSRFLDGTLAVCEARVAEARSEARAMLGAASDELAGAVRERAALVEEVIASPPTPREPEVSDRYFGVEAEGTAEGVASVEVVEPAERVDPGGVVEPAERVDPGGVAPRVVTGTPVASGRRRASLISVLMWIVGGALVVVGVAFAIVVVLMLLD